MIMNMYVCVLCGTTIVSDCCVSNIRLSNKELMDHTIECCVGFRASRMGAHTTRIEATWKHATYTSGLTEKMRLNL